MPIKHLDIVVVGDEELVNALRLAGSSRYYMIKGDHDVRENVRKALAELIAEPDVGIVVMLEDYAQYVEDLLTRVRKGRAITPVIIEVPSKFGTKYPAVREDSRASVSASIGCVVEI